MRFEIGEVPEVPVYCNKVPVDVFEDGSFKVGKEGDMARGALFQFWYKALFVGGDKTFMPRAGSRAATMYRCDVLFCGRELYVDGRLYHVELHGHDDDDGPPRPYVLHITEQVKDPAQRVTKKVAEVYSAHRQVLLELVRRGYRQAWIV